MLRMCIIVTIIKCSDIYLAKADIKCNGTTIPC